MDEKEKVDQVIKEVREKAEPIIKEAMEKAEPYIKQAREKADPYLKQAKQKADPYLKEAKSKSKKAAKNLSEKVAEVTCKNEVYIQYGDREIRTEDILDTAKADYLSKGHEKTDMKEFQVYIKPYDNAAYYVVNHAETGKITF